MTDLEIRKAITLIGLKEKYKETKSIVFDNAQRCYWVETAGFSSWPLENPLEDKALCWDLMLKHEIKLSRNGKNEYVGMWSHCRGEDHCDPQMAICLAIIEKYKE